jgi:probable HAF family extracellular repeat protein
MQFRLFAAFALFVFTILITGVRGRADITALPAYTIIDLGTLGGDVGEAFAVNDNGIVVGTSDLASGYGHGFRYDGTLPIQDLGKLVGEGSDASDVNASGVIVGTGNPGLGTRIVAWNGGPASVPAPFAAINSRGLAINDGNTVAGNISLPPLFRPQAILHTLGQPSFTNIGALLASLGGTRSVANDVNESNVAVGWVVLQDFSIPGRGFRFVPPDQVELLPTFGIYDDTPRAINESGQIVGQCGVAPGLTHACIWSGGSITDINPFAAEHSGANGINDKGEIVGAFLPVVGGSSVFAFLRTGGQTIDLNTLIAPGSGWQLQIANGINEHSQIVGRGLHNGLLHAFLLTPTTMPGANVVATPIEPATGSTPVKLTFDQVTQGGVSTVTAASSGPPPPAGFAVGSPEVYYEISTTVSFTGFVQVCIDVTGVDFGGTTPVLHHYESGSWVAVASTFDPAANTVCGSVTSLSPFAVFRPQPAASYAVRLLYDPARAARAGSTVPIRIQILNAAGTNVSAADLVVNATRVEQVSASTTGPADDSGHSNPDGNFRFDPALGGGGYIFNLSTAGLSTGTYALRFTVGGGAIEYAAGFQISR